MSGLTIRLIKKQAGRFFCLLVVLILGSFTIATSGYLIRSIKKTDIETNLDYCGDYDYVIYNADLGYADALVRSSGIEDIGLYYELGTVTDLDGVEEFKAVALRDELSEDIYHMTCVIGSYPVNENEVAIDLSVAHTYGIPPYPGEAIELKKYNSDGDYIGSQTYRVSGLFRDAAPDTQGGWYRWPFGVFKEDYSMPAVFFYPSDIESWGCTQETVLVRSNSFTIQEMNDIINLTLRETESCDNGISYNSMKMSVYSDSLGIDYNSIPGKEGSFSWQYLSKATSEGLFERDFYSTLLLPVISLLVIVTEAVSVYMLVKNIIADRKDHYGVLRSIGMSSKTIIRNLVIEMFCFGLISSVIGAVTAYVVHKPTISILNSSLNLHLYDGINVQDFIKNVTYDPIVTAIIVCLLSVLLALVIPVYKLYRMYPSELLSASDQMFVGRNNKSQRNKTKTSGGWLGTLNRRIDLHAGTTMLVMGIVLSSMLFGYLFFRALSDRDAGYAKWQIEQFGFEGQGYSADRHMSTDHSRYNVFNRHDAGVSPEALSTIASNPDVTGIRAAIVNESTRMVFDEEPSEDIKRLLNNRRLNIPEEMMFADVNITGESYIFEHMGYGSDAIMYELPTVGVTPEELSSLEAEVVAGQINLDRIRSGEEIVLAVPEELEDICISSFPIGSTLPFDDIVLTGEEEVIDLSNIEGDDWMVYDTYVVVPDGTEVRARYDAIGSRYELSATVGAIVVLHDENDINTYLTSGSEWARDLGIDAGMFIDDSVGMSVLCLGETFENWGLPDKNFTTVRVSISDDADIYQFDKFWYQTLSGSVGIKTDSTFDYVDMIHMTTQRTMVVFYIMVISLILLGMVSIISSLYTKTRGNTERIQSLRRIGLSVKQVSLLIYTQNIYYPIIATIIAIIPVYWVQSFFNATYAKTLSGELYPTGTGSVMPWYIVFPITQNMFSYNFFPALIVCFLTGVLLIVIGTLPQIMYLEKMKMIAEKEE